MIEPINNPGDMPDAGIFNLPPDFPADKLASEWVAEERVRFKEQRQTLVGTGFSADGWTIYRADPKDKPTVVVNGQNKKFVLMVRGRGLQNEVNALYGNVSKQRINREVTGETVGGKSLQDTGILTEESLKQTVGAGEVTTLPLNNEKAQVAST